MKQLIMMTLVMLVAAAPAVAETVTVEFIGSVESSQVNSGPFADVAPGDPVYAGFYVDSNNYIDSASYGVRAYYVDTASFELTIGSVGPIPLVDPQPWDRTVYFCVRESDPVVDGFFFACNPEWDTWFPAIDVPGQIDPFMGLHWYVSYSGDTLESLDILDAVGTYDYTGMGSYHTAIADAWVDAIILTYGETRISTGTVATENASWGSVKSLYR